MLQRSHSGSNGCNLRIVLRQTVGGVEDEDDTESNVSSGLVGEGAQELVLVLANDVELLNEGSRSNLPEVVDATVVLHSVVEGRRGLEDAALVLNVLERRIVDVSSQLGDGLVEVLNGHLIEVGDALVNVQGSEYAILLSESGSLVSY